MKIEKMNNKFENYSDVKKNFCFSKQSIFKMPVQTRKRKAPTTKGNNVSLQIINLHINIYICICIYILIDLSYIYIYRSIAGKGSRDSSGKKASRRKESQSGHSVPAETSCRRRFSCSQGWKEGSFLWQTIIDPGRFQARL